MDPEILAALSDGDPLPLRSWLMQREVNAEKLRELPRWNAVPLQRGVPSARRPPDKSGEVASAMSSEMPKVHQAPGGTALMLLYLMHEVEEAWEVSYHFGPLWDTLRGARDYLLRPGRLAPGREPDAVQAVLAVMDCLEHRISAENAMTTCRPDIQAQECEEAVSRAREAAALGASLSSTYPEISAFVGQAAREAELYCDAVARAARGATAFFRHGAPLDDVINDLAGAESSEIFSDNICRSELRAHRFSLMGLHARSADPWLRVDHGNLVYMYPFSLRGLDAHQVVEEVGEHAGDWRLVGARPLTVHAPLDLDDVWDGSDSRGRRYEGASVHLPDVLVRGLDGALLGRAGVQVRFSQLGNHYVRFVSEIVEKSAPEMYAMLFRAAPEHGAVRIAFEGAGGGSWPRLADLAVQLVEDCGREMQRGVPAAAIRAVARPGTYQVVLSVNAASTSAGPSGAGPRREVRSTRELFAAAGVEVLANPVASQMGSLADWVRRPVTPGDATVARAAHDELVVRTPNTTLLAALGTAEFMNGTRRSLAEFAASLDGLFAGWSDELAGHYERVQALHQRSLALTRNGAAGAGELAELSKGLDDEKVRLDEFAVHARSIISLIQSPSLVSSPVDAEELRFFLRHSHFQQRVEELTSQIDEVANEQLGATIDKMAAQRVDQQRAKLEVFLAVIAAAGVSGLIQVLQAGFTGGDFPRALAVTGVPLVVIGAVIVGIWVGRGGARQ